MADEVAVAAVAEVPTRALAVTAEHSAHGHERAEAEEDRQAIEAPVVEVHVVRHLVAGVDVRLDDLRERKPQAEAEGCHPEHHENEPAAAEGVLPELLVRRPAREGK